MILQPVSYNKGFIGEHLVETPVFSGKDLEALVSKLEEEYGVKPVRDPENGFTIIFCEINSFKYGLSFWGIFDFINNFIPHYFMKMVNSAEFDSI